MNLISRAKDPNKDQTYFIWQIKKDQLPHILFPVGEFDVKADVRAFAHTKDLITSDKPDSQGLCFVGQTSLREMLLQTLGHKEGFIYTYLTQEQIDKLALTVHKKNKILITGSDKFKVKLGQHEGAFLFTIGQRQNLGLSNGPWFVAEVDIENNEVIVCHNEYQEEIMSKYLKVKELNWHLDIDKDSTYTKSTEILSDEEKSMLKKIVGTELSDFRIHKLRLKAQIRYRSQVCNCQVYVLQGKVIVSDNFAIVEFDQPIKAAAKGQSIVFYDYDTDQFLVGGGVIDRVIK